MGRGKIIIVVLVLFMILGVFVGVMKLMNPTPLVITAYDGPVASMSRIEDTYPDSGGVMVRSVGVADALIYPDVPDIFDYGTPSGLKCEINADPNVIEFEEIDTITRLDVDVDAKTNTSENVAVQIVKGTMGIKVSTFSGGLADAYPTTFWIKLEENDFSVFQGVDDSYAAFLEVYTTDAPLIYGDIDVVPSAGGVNIPMTPLGEQPPTPEWITRLYGGVENLRIVEFPIKVMRGHGAFGLPLRTEAYVDFRIGFDVILFGYWEQVHDYREWDAGIPDVWGDLMAFLLQTAWIFGGFVIMVGVLYFAPGRYKLIGPVVFVVFLMIGLGFFAEFLGASG